MKTFDLTKYSHHLFPGRDYLALVPRSVQEHYNLYRLLNPIEMIRKAFRRASGKQRKSNYLCRHCRSNKDQVLEDFLDAVKKCKAAGVTPIIVGGADEWPLHFHPVFLMMRILGKAGMAAAYKGDNGGFAGPDMVKA